MIIYHPTSESELAGVVATAGAAVSPLSIEGGGTRRGLGRATQAAATLSLAHLTGITLHEPAEMILAARAGTPVSLIVDALAAKGQMLAFEPMDHRFLLSSDGEPTIGAVVAGNISGPRRITAGACRDSLVGVRFVNGRGEVVKNGGRVMKNVTGLDLVKLLAGSWGTLGVLSEVTFKVSPMPETAVTLVFRGLDDAAAIRLLTQAMASPFEPSGAAHLPAMDGEGARTLLRIENLEPSVRYRRDALAKELVSFGKADMLEGQAHETLWRDIRDVRMLAEPRDATIWRLSVAPSQGAAVVAAIRERRAVRHFFDWAGGLVWLATDEGDDAGADVIRGTVARFGGHATLVRASEPLRASVAVFEPLAPGVMALQAGLKKSFDPFGILNPGRMYPGL
jgi:glycolate oxidase FAD binding subunit